MKKFNVGILGTENSHANVFCKAFNVIGENGSSQYPDFNVNLAYGEYPESNKKLVDRFTTVEIANSIDEMVDKVDCAMVTSRDGKHHARLAMPFIKAGKPCFIDKPFTNGVEDALLLLKTAKETGAVVCGGSSLKYNEHVLALKKAKEEMGEKFHCGYMSAPIDYKSEYGGFWFYAAHLAEMCMEIFGFNPKAVVATINNDSVHAIVEYDKYSITLDFAEKCPFTYCGLVTGEEKTVYKDIELDYTFRSEIDVFEKVVKEKVMPHSYEELLAPIVMLEAIIKSYETGERVKIIYPEI